MAPERVALISNSLSSTIVFRNSLVRKLRDADRLAAIFSTQDDRSNLESGALAAPIVLLTGRGIKGRINAFRMELSQMRASNARIIHGFTHFGNFASTALWLVNGGKLILSVTGMGRAFSNGGIYNIILRSMILLFYFHMQFVVHRIIVQNTDDQKLMTMLFFPVYRHKIIITNGSGIDLDHFSGVTRPNADESIEFTNVGFFSRALPEKGVDEFYRLANSKRYNKNICFHHWGHYGVGVYSSESIRAHANRNNVHFHGFSVDPREHILTMDIIVLPSGYREGLSRLAIEAMLAGKVLVARSTTGVRDHLKDGDTAFVYSGADGLEQAFDRAISSNLDIIGRAATAYARHVFNVDRVDLAYMDAYGFSTILPTVGTTQ